MTFSQINKEPVLICSFCNNYFIKITEKGSKALFISVICMYTQNYKFPALLNVDNPYVIDFITSS